MSTAIQWTDETWNPVVGCTRVSAGCDNCYAAWHSATRLKNRPQYQGLAVITPSGRPEFTGTIRLLPERLEDPLHWRMPRRVFVNSMSDLFHDGIPDDYLDRVFAVMAVTPQHTYQVLTKRPRRMRDYQVTPERWDAARQWLRSFLPKKSMGAWEYVGVVMANQQWPLPNVWLGVSCEDQNTADERIPLLRETPATVRFISAEPLLGPIDIERACCRCPWPADAMRTRHQLDCPCARHPLPRNIPLDWVIVGGESGPGARPMAVAWARAIVEQCRHHRVAVFVKQLGAFPCTEREVGTAKGGSPVPLTLHDRKGGDMDEWPTDLRVRQFPRAAA